MLCVSWLLYQGLSCLDSLVFSVHQKSAYVTVSRIQVCTEFDVVWLLIAVK